MFNPVITLDSNFAFSPYLFFSFRNVAEGEVGVSGGGTQALSLSQSQIGSWELKSGIFLLGQLAAKSM